MIWQNDQHKTHYLKPQDIKRIKTKKYHNTENKQDEKQRPHTN
jgi:hypothetical protein